MNMLLGFITSALCLLSMHGLTRGGSVDGPRYFVCSDGERVPYSYVCDGEAACSNDEITILNGTEDFDPFGELHNCTNPKNSYSGSCLASRIDICNGIMICGNVSPCDLKCDNYFKCQNGSCFPRWTVCNHDPCIGCWEDHGWPNGVGFKCARSGIQCVLPQQLLHDDISDCDGEMDLCFNNVDRNSRNAMQPLANLNPAKCFLCLDGSMIIAASGVCDGTIDCPDLSDECICTSGKPSICEQVVFKNPTKSTNFVDQSECKNGEVQCKNGNCISRWSICDGVLDCEEDESYDICKGTKPCINATRIEQCRCIVDRFQKSCRAESAIACNGVRECPVREVLGWKTISNQPPPEDECNKTCVEGPRNFTCNNYLPMELKLTLWGAFCERGDIERSIPGEHYCDGIVDCIPSMTDEFNCDISSESERFMCNATRPRFVSIAMEQVCDGIADCLDASDEYAETCKDDDKPKFTCPALNGKMVNIVNKSRCDFIINCDNGFDEENCTDDRFYCEGKSPLFVRRNQVGDGLGDCDDWSDECPTKNGSTLQNAFSSRYRMIDSALLSVLVWVMGIVATVGNLSVIVREAMDLSQQRKRRTSSAIRANRILILNLAIADLLMGFYLIFVGTMAAKMSDIYCAKDTEWRSSSTCIALGMLSVVSSETSVVTIIMLTACRLYAMLKPLKSSLQPSFKRVILMVSTSWVTSVFLASLPLIPQLSRTFVPAVEFKFNPFASRTNVKMDEAKNVFKSMISYGGYNLSEDLDAFLQFASWRDLKAKASEIHLEHYFEPQKHWGYYSTASVCIPKFFVTTSDPAWIFSFTITLFNFFAFLFVASAYGVIYCKSKRDANLTTGQNREKEHKQMIAMQRKILRLIATDFCCWMPICITAFVSLSGHEMPDAAYAVSAVVLLPLNSALNPLLYSDVIDTLLKKYRDWRKTFSRQKNSSAEPIALQNHSSREFSTVSAKSVNEMT